ncbi:MAG: Fic family protein [Candidatus Marinimicrobia bacterium]|jgi:Fic family protein|nr:Fic family protein [Candidatus Neomarinimicrobiota bacterium]MBT3617986.1 Fic family protein [Candidatus Neomarinimicrobiota bacterium]MBT3828972.1 Fic family protein [Candidatus Neomarinimicrobiota bacterium]MBT3997487.1 Fic family protein [Candidatus Neomarinimicrobiota bacterium]MBT4570041.1 Fic family protein [Candidatus Neomarinimicrobiota bacterium]
MWIHEHQKWTDFIWDAERLGSKLANIRHAQGRLLGRMEGLGFDLKQEASLNTLTNDVVRSSAIEGQNLNPAEVRSSIAGRLGIKIVEFVHVSRDVEGMVEMMLDATQQFSKSLTKERLYNWHTSLFPTGGSGLHPITVGDWRSMDTGPMQVVSGAIGNENIHYEAPSADRLEQEMAAFLEWFDSKNDVDPVLKAGIAHLWFVSIHPFEDGNGRIARAIADMALARADGISERFYSLSTQMETERKNYYSQLEKQQRSTPEITGWLEWFLDCLGRAIEGSEKTLRNVLFKAHLWDKINQKPVNERQRLIINRMLEDNFEGHMNTSKYAKLAKCSTDTALRDIQVLKARDILIQNLGRGRSTSYRLPAPKEDI